MRKHVCVFAAALLVGACAQPGDSGTPFSSRDGDWQEAMNAGDVESLVALYAEDARLMPPNYEATVGREAVKMTFGAMIDAGLSIELDVVETQSSGDVAYNIGNYKLMADGAVTDQGKYVETWRRGSDGVWLMTNDIWNSDMPAAHGNGELPHLMVYHEVEDFDRWIAAWRGDDSRRDLFKANGVAHLHTFQSADNPDLTGVVMAIGDMEAFNAFMDSEEVAAAAAADGVDLEATTFLNEVK